VLLRCLVLVARGATTIATESSLRRASRCNRTCCGGGAFVLLCGSHRQVREWIMDAAGTCSAYGGEVAMARRCTRLFALELPQPGATLVMAAFVTLDCVTCFGACLFIGEPPRRGWRSSDWQSCHGWGSTVVAVGRTHEQAIHAPHGRVRTNDVVEVAAPTHPSPHPVQASRPSSACRQWCARLLARARGPIHRALLARRRRRRHQVAVTEVAPSFSVHVRFSRRLPARAVSSHGRRVPPPRAPPKKASQPCVC
jgi:hypothetical protein